MREKSDRDQKKYILSIDLGTSGSKTAIVSVTGNVVGFDFEAVPLHLFEGGGAEQDPDDWWNAVMATSKRLLAKGLVPREDIVAVNCSTQWVGTVPVDRDGRHLMNAVIWMDSRGAEHVRDIVDGPLKIEGYDVFKLMKWIRLTGGAPPLSGKDPAGHIPYIRHAFPDVYRATYKFLEPKDYINLCLTGEFAASFDSIACHWVTDNRDIHNVHYNDKLLRISTLERDKLPDLKPANAVLGPLKKEVALELGLSDDVKVLMGTPDLMAAAVGSGAVRDFEVHSYIGTSSWILAHVPFKKTDLFHSIASLPSGIPGRYLIVNEQETAGASLTFLRDNILYHKDALLREEALPDVYKIFDRIAEKVPAGSNRVIYTPWLNGERTPVEDNTLRACLYNFSLKTTREDVIRAFMEGVAYNQKWALTYVEKFMGRKAGYVNMVGGGASSDIWCQIHADVLNRPVKQIKDPIQSNARGTAFLAAAALGYIEMEDIPQHIQIKNVYEPDPSNRGIYDELFNAYLQIYKQNRKIFRGLNKK